MIYNKIVKDILPKLQYLELVGKEYGELVFENPGGSCMANIVESVDELERVEFPWGLSGKEEYLAKKTVDKGGREQVDELIQDDPDGSHECNDGTDGKANVDGTDGRCTVCGQVELI